MNFRASGNVSVSPFHTGQKIQTVKTEVSYNFLWTGLYYHLCLSGMRMLSLLQKQQKKRVQRWSGLLKTWSLDL